jgi:DNA-binding FrmR family transcriptional regulator
MKADVKSKVTRQLKVIEGQVRGLQKMVAEDTYCVDVITQATAVRNSLSSVEGRILESHLRTCVVKQMQEEHTDKAVAEILAVYKLAKKTK